MLVIDCPAISTMTSSCAKTRLRPDRSTIGVFDAMASGDGRLATEAGSGPPDRYRCDPADPEQHVQRATRRDGTRRSWSPFVRMMSHTGQRVGRSDADD